MDPPERSRNDERRGGGGGSSVGDRHGSVRRTAAMTMMPSSSSSSLRSDSSHRRRRQRRRQQQPPNERDMAAAAAAPLLVPTSSGQTNFSGKRAPRRRSVSANDLEYFTVAIEQDTVAPQSDDDYIDDHEYCSASRMIMSRRASPHYDNRFNKNIAATGKRSSNNSIAGGSLRSLPSYDSLLRRQQRKSSQPSSQLHRLLVQKSRQQQMNHSYRADDGHDYDYDHYSYDDDTASVFSTASSSYSHHQNQHNRHHHHHYSKSNRRISHSPSVTSRTSQSSHNSSFRIPKKKYSNNKQRQQRYQYESDDSICSLLSLGGANGDDVNDGMSSASSAASSSDEASTGSCNDDVIRKEGERMVMEFAETMSRLESLGLGINSTDDDDHHDVGNEVGCRSHDADEEAFDAKEQMRNDNDKDCPWWIQELEAEGWFQHDTSTIYADGSNSSSGMVPQTERQSGAILGKEADTDLNDVLVDGHDRECVGAAVDQERRPYPQLDDSDTSTVGDEDVGDWEERLWALARAHYLDFYGRQPHDNPPEMKLYNQAEVDEQTLNDQEQNYRLNYELEQKGVLEFRSILLKCVQAYIHAFYGIVGDTSKSDKAGNDADEIEEEGKSIAKNEMSTADPMSLKVYPYIPLSIARGLFLEVIKIADSDSNSRVVESERRVDETTINLERKAAIVTSVLVNGALNIFRRYQFITPMKPAIEHGRDSTNKERKRLNNNRAKTNLSDAQAELEDFLYGEMLDGEIGVEEAKSSETLEANELEIRIRSRVVRLVLNRVDNISECETAIGPCWAKSAICQVLLSNIQAGTERRAGDIPNHDGGDEHSQPLPTTKYQPMAQLYIMRYSPVFLLRALQYQIEGSSVTSHCNGNIPLPTVTGLGGPLVVSMKDLLDLLYEGSYIRGRVEFQGPYDATITHLSNWQALSSFTEKCNKLDDDKTRSAENVLDDEKSYDRLATLISSVLCSHLETMLDTSGYNDIKTRNSNINGDSTDIRGREIRDSVRGISSHNFSETASNCIETGRALYHLGVCLGRRQRDCARSQHSCQAAGLGDASNSVSLEVTSYKNALDAYRAAMTVLSKAESVALLDKTRAVANGRRSNRNMTGKMKQDSEISAMPSTALQDIRVAKSSVELHLADTLNCLGYCHDKLFEYDKSLLAYRESLSLYVKHLGSSHEMVSKVLHNMGAIHVGQGQWGEATSCFRQCLAILKQKSGKERTANHITNRSEDIHQICITLQCLGDSLAELGEYDASIACFEEIINSLDRPDLIAMDVHSQMGGVHLKQASKLSREFNRLCHSLLCSDSDDQQCEDPGLILERQLRLERLGKDSIAKSIHSRRQLCYTAPGNVAKHTDNVFLQEKVADSQNSDHCEVLAVLPVSDESPPTHVASLAKDLLTMGRLEFRSRSYEAALSYFWESLLLSCLLILQRLGDVDTARKVSDLLVVDSTLLKSEGALFQVSETHVGLLCSMDIASVEFVQVLFLIGVSYTRTHKFDIAHSVLHKALTLLKERSPAETNQKANETLDVVIVQLDIAHLLLRIGFVDSERGNIEAAASRYMKAIQVFSATSNRPFFTSGMVESADNDRKITGVSHISPLVPEMQCKEIGLLIKNGLACAYHRLGVTYAERGQNDDAMNSFEDSARVFKEIQAATDKFLNWKSVNLFPFASRCFWEEPSAIETALLLSDINERSGSICMDVGPELFSLQCFERSVGMRELVTFKAGNISNVDSESLIESFDESVWIRKNACVYSAMLLLLERSEKAQYSVNAPVDDVSMLNDGCMPSKGDIFFRLGNLQFKLGQLKDAVDSYKKAEELAVAILGTKEHAIIMNILHNMGNTYRSIAASSSDGRRRAKEEAVSCYSESMRISQALYGKHHVNFAEILQSLAVLHLGVSNLWLATSMDENIDTNDDEVAYKYFKEALTIRRKENSSGNDLEVAFILHQLGDLCLRNSSIGVDDSLGDTDTLKLLNDALNYLSESLNIRRLLLHQYHTSIADTYQSAGVAHLNLALTFKNGGDKMDSETRKALKSLTSALEIRKSNQSSKGSDSVLAEAHCLFHLGRVEETNSNYDGAKAYYSNALLLLQTEGKYKSTLVSKSINLAATAGLDGTLMIELEAINLWVARVLYHVAAIRKVDGNFDDCVSCYKEALRLRRRCKSADKYGLFDAQANFSLAQVLQDHGHYDKSIESYSQSLRAYVAHFGKDCIHVAEILTGLGKSFAMKLVFNKTIQCYNQAMRVYENCDGTALKEKKGLLHREIAVTLQRLDGDVFDVLGHYRSCVVFLEEFSERQVEQESTHGLNKQLLHCYSEMLVVLRQVLRVERDLNIKGELYEEIEDVLHRMGNLHASFAQYDEALNCFIEVLPTQQNANEKLRVADILFNMGNIYLEQGHYEKSLECLRESYGITREVLGDDNRELHSTMYLISIAMTSLSDSESALVWLTHSLAVLSSNGGDVENVKDAATRGKLLSQMGIVYEKMGDHKMAFSCFQESIQLLTSTHRDDRELSNALNSMGNLLRSDSNNDRALDCYDKSLTIRDQLGDELMIANTKNNIGAVLAAVKVFDRAMAFSAQALRIKTDRLGCECVETGRALVNMGQHYLDQQLYSRAEKYFGQGLKIFRNYRCEDDPDIGMCLHKLGVIKEALFDDASALDYYLEAIHTFKNINVFEKHVTMASSLHNAALIYMRQSDFHSALDCMTEAFNTKSSAFGSHHRETSESQHFLGIIYLEMKDADSAHFHLTNALNARRECSGVDHLDVARTLFGLGHTHFTRDEFEDAIKCLSEALRISRRRGSSEAESKAELQLGTSYQELGCFEIAIKHLLEALNLMNSSPESSRMDVAQALFRLGICLCETGQLSQSLEKFNECLEMRKVLLGNLHIECANTYESIGIVQQKIECHEEAINSFERALAIKKTSLDKDDEDICVLLHFIGMSLFALEKFEKAVVYFKDSSERKKTHHGRADGEYAMSVIGLASAYAKIGDEYLSVECYREAIESGGLSSDSWELGVAHKFLARYFLDQGMHTLSIERYREAVSIFEWHINNSPGSEIEHETLAQCYSHLLELEDEVAGPLSENRAELCYKLANCYLHANKLEDAVVMYREAIMIQTQLFGAEHLSVANSLHNIGNCYRSLSDFEKSAECLTNSLSLLQKNFEEENEEVADTTHCLALTLMAKCELEEATSLFETSLAIWKKNPGRTNLKIASTFNNLALIGQMRGTWNSALANCNDALKMQRLTVGEEISIMAGTLECMGRVYMDKREFEPAIRCFCKCLAHKQELELECGIIYRTRGEALKSREMFINAEDYAAKQLGLTVSQSGEIDLQTLTSKLQERKRETIDRHLLSLAEQVMFYGLVLMNLEKFDGALQCLRFSNVIFQAKYGSDHLTIAANFHHTGFVLEKISDMPNSRHGLEEALELLTESFRIRRLHLVDSHSDLEKSLLCLGRVHHKLGNIEDALHFLTDAVKLRDIRFGRTHSIVDDADALLRVGQLQQQSGKLRQALDSFDQCLDIRRKIAGSQHPSVGEILFYIGNLLREIGDLGSAQKKFEESLEIARQIDPKSIEVADTLFSLGALHTEKKQFSLALDSYLASLQIQKAKGSKSALAEILNNIGITYFEMKELDKALIYHEEALESLRQELGDDHADVAFCWYSIGANHQENGDQADALACFQQAVSIERSELYLQSLGFCLVAMGDNENAYVCLDEALRMKVLDGSSESDDDLAEIKRHLGIILMRRKKFDEALRCFEDALQIKLAHCGESEKDSINLMQCFDGALEVTSALFGTQHIKYGHLLHRKANFFGAKKDHSLAIEAYVEALRIYKEEYGDSHLSVANTLFNLGISLNGKGSPDKAVRCFKKALRITKARLGEDHLDVADTYEQIAESYKILLRHHDAKSYYENAVAVRKQTNGGIDVKSAAIMHELGKLHTSEGAWVDAEKAFEESLKIRTIELGRDDPLVAESMYSLGLMYMERNNHKKALNCFEESLRIRKSKLVNSSQLAASFHSLGDVHRAVGNVCKSLFCYDKAIQIFTEVHGKANDRVASSLAGKGKCFNSDKQYRKALSCFSECLDVRKSIDGPTLSTESGDVLLLIGDAYSQLGDIANASTSFASALAIYRQTHGSQPQIVADVLQKMADHYVKVGEFECGYSCVNEALAIRKELVGDDDITMGDSLYCQGRILYEWKNDDEAIHCFERAREIYQKVGNKRIGVANSNFYLGCISERKGDFELAVQYLQASLSGRREHLDKMDSEIAVTLASLGRVYSKKSEFGLAVLAFSDCLRIREANSGAGKTSQIEVADALFDLGTALQKSMDTQRSAQLFTDALKVYQHHLDNPNDVKIAKCHFHLGEIYESTNERTKAISSLEQAISIYESHIGTDPSEKEIIASSKVHVYSGKAETLFCIATVKERLGDQDTALTQYGRAMRIYKSLFGLDSLHVGKILYRLGMMKGRGGSIDKAMILLDESLRIRISHLGNSHVDVAETLFGMGVILEKRKDYGAAMTVYSDCLRIRSSKFGNDSMEVAEVVVNIGVVRGNKGDYSGALKSWNKALSIYRKKGLGDDEELVATVIGHQRLANQQLRRSGKNRH